MGEAAIDALIAPVAADSPVGPHRPELALELATGRQRIDSLLAQAFSSDRRQRIASQPTADEQGREALRAGLEALADAYIGARPTILSDRRDLVDSIPKSDRPKDWQTLYDDACDALKQSKDLGIARELTESALMYRGFEGLAFGLTVTGSLLKEFAPTVHPARADVEDDRQYFDDRRAILDAFDDREDGIGAQVWRLPLAGVRLTREQYTFPLAYRHVEVEKDAGRQAQIREAVSRIPSGTLAALAAELTLALEALTTLESAIEAAFAGAPVSPPTLRQLRTVLENIEHFVRQLPTMKTPRGEATPAASSNPTASLAADGDSVLVGLQKQQAAIATARSPRHAFLARVDMAERALEVGLYTLAIPLLESVKSAVKDHDLVGWEERATLDRIGRAMNASHQQAEAARAADAIARAASVLSEFNEQLMRSPSAQEVGTSGTD